MRSLSPPFSFWLPSSTDSASPKLPDAPLHPIPIPSALIWVFSSLTGSSYIDVPTGRCEAQIHAVHTSPTSKCPGVSLGLQPAPCPQQEGLQRRCPVCFSEGVGVYMFQLSPPPLPVGRITEAHRLHKSPRLQWNKAPIPHGGWIKVHLSTSSLPCLMPPPLRGFPAIASLR